MIDFEPKAPKQQPKVHEAEPTWFNVPGGNLAFKKQQIITPEMLQHTHEARLASAVKAGELHEVASVPSAVVEHWQRQGFDIMTDKNIKARDIVKRLRAEGLEKFISTEKSV